MIMPARGRSELKSESVGESMPGNTSLTHSPGADPAYRTHWWNCYFSLCYKPPLSFMSVKWNAENMWHVSALSSLISHSSL